VPSCGSVSAGEQEPTLPPDQLRSLYRVRRCYCLRSSCRSSYSYGLHCYAARMKLGNVELVDNCARRKLDTMHVPLKFENSEQITLSVMMFTLVIFCTLGTLWDPSCV